MTSPNPARDEQLRIQAVGAAISRRDWHAVEQAYNAIRDEFDRRPAAKPPASGVDAVATEPPYRPLEDFLDWAGGRWEVEVKNRPLNNVHRRALDTTWRQVIRKLGADPEALFGPAHDDLVEAQQASTAAPKLSLSDDDREIVASAIRSALSPAATSGSEAGGGPGAEQPDAQRYGAEFPGEPTTVGDLFKPALSKPASSPAGGDVDGTAQIALGHFKTTTERAQQITKLEDGLQRCVEALAPHALDDHVAAQARAIGLAALSPSTSAAEPVVYGPDEEGLYYTTNVAGMREACDPPAPAAVDGQRALRIALFDLVEWIEMEVDLSLRPGLRKRVADAKALCERPRACLATDKEGA